MTTSGRAWREQRNQGVEVTLPSGNVVRLRPVSIQAFLKLPNIPDTLTPVIHDMIAPKEATKVQTVEDVINFHRVLDALCAYAFVSPRIVEAPESDDEISMGDVDTADKLAVLGLLDKTARQLESFRPQQADALESVQ